MLLGDNQSWLFGRTVILQETLTGLDQVLVDLRTQPLCRYLFNSGNMIRDYIHISRQNTLWERCSHLRIAASRCC